jgi:hypothetical protein
MGILFLHRTLMLDLLRATIDEKAPAPSFQTEPVLTENSYCFNIGNNAKLFESEEYQNCLEVNGDKTYYLGVIDGCKDRANTQKTVNYGMVFPRHRIQ